MSTGSETFFPISSASIDVGGQKLHYVKIGNGKKLVLAFHGYANDASMFLFLTHPDFTVLSFDLPFQGESVGVKGSVLEKKDFAGLVQRLMEQYGVQKIGLLGFSLGARVCLCIVEQLPDCIRNVVLVAPDGVKHNYFYQFLTGSMLGRFLFRGFIRFGKSYLKLFSLMHYFGLLSQYKYRFALKYIRTPASRDLLLDIWMSTRRLIPNLDKTKQFILRMKIPVHILLGQKDRVIPLKNATLFKGSNEHIQLHIFERGHNLLEYDEVKGTVAAWLFRTNQSRSV